MKYLTGAQIRQMYLDFFSEKGHNIEPSASLVPHEDPSLLWINSGVATLKKYFDGRVIPETILKTWGKRHVIIRFSKCSETSPLVNISKKKPSHGHGNF
jgi:hypothetical protein